MSTPIRDAQKMGSAFANNSSSGGLQHHDSNLSNFSGRMSRAERRRMIAEALDASSTSMNLSNSSLSMQDELISSPGGKIWDRT